MSIILSLIVFISQQLSFFFLAHTAEIVTQIPAPAAPVLATSIPLPRQPTLQKDWRTLKEIRHGDSNKPLIALTFDDGFEKEASIAMLNTLRDKQVQATFFLKGNWIIEHKDIVDQIIQDGHELGNHTYNHPHFTRITTAKANDEIDSQANLLQEQHAYSPKPLFRFPYGDRNPAMLQRANDHGYLSVLWDIDTMDWLHDSDFIEKTAVDEAHNGAIILMHLGKAATAKALPTIIDKLREKGFTLVTVSQLIDADSNVL